MLWGFKHENRSTIWTYLASWIIPEVTSVFTWTRVVAVKAVTSDVDMWWVRTRKAFLPWWICSQCLLSNHMCSCSERSCLWEQDKVWIRTCDFTWRRFMDASEVSCRICRVRLNAFLDFFCSKGFQFCLGKTQHLFGRKSIQNSEVQFICYYPSSFTANTLKWKHRQHLAALVHETHGVLFHLSGSGITLLYQMLGAIGAAT